MTDDKPVTRTANFWRTHRNYRKKLDDQPQRIYESANNSTQLKYKKRITLAPVTIVKSDE